MIKRLVQLWYMAYRGASAYGVLKNLLWLCYAISDFLTIVLLQNVYDAFTLLGISKNFIIQVIWFGIILLVNEVMLAVVNVVTEDSSYLMMENLGNKLHKTVNGIEVIKFEDDKFLNQIQQARKGTENATFLLNVLSMVLFYHIPYLLMVGFYLIKNQPRAILVLLLIVIPVALNQWIKMKEYEKIIEDSSALEREMLHYKKCISDMEYFKETRLLGAFTFFRKLFCDIVQQYNQLKMRVAKKMCCLGSVMQIISLLGYIGTIVLLIIEVCMGNIHVSVFFVILTSFSTVFSMIENLLGYYIGQISEQSGNVNYLMDFFAMGENDKEEKSFTQTVENIELRNVTFSYPNTSRPIIKNISCAFSDKETVAIVGENGAGKTTFVKLLAGLYIPQQGEVAYNGKNIEEYDKSSLWERVSSVFQTFQKYKMTLWENLFPGEQGTIAVAEQNLEWVGMPIDSDLFSENYDTVLSKEFGGIDLSGGQWQKIAIARGMSKKYDVLLLDEPTSAIDPEEESRLYRLFAEMSKDCLSFIVTHRLGICKMVDKIIVLDNGEIVEIGTHEELIKKNGKYFEMFQNQSKMYETV